VKNIREVYVEVASRKIGVTPKSVRSYIQKFKTEVFDAIEKLCKEFNVTADKYLSYLWDVLLPIYRKVTKNNGLLVPPSFFKGEMAQDKFQRYLKYNCAEQTREESLIAIIHEEIRKALRLASTKNISIKEVIKKSDSKVFLAWLIAKRVLLINDLAPRQAVEFLKIPRIVRTLEDNKTLEFLRMFDE